MNTVTTREVNVRARTTGSGLVGPARITGSGLVGAM